MNKNRKPSRRIRHSSVEILEPRMLLSTVSYTVTDLGVLPGQSSPESQANAINAGGQVVGSSTAGDGTIEHPVLFSNGSLTDLNPSGGDSQAFGINGEGEIVGKAGTAFLYAGGSLLNLGTLPGGNTSIAYSINANGQIAGDSSVVPDASVTHAFLYQQGDMLDLGTLGGSQSNAFAINDSGQVVGLAYTASQIPHAFLYSPGGTMTDIGQVFNGAASSARAINGEGQVAGYGFVPATSTSHAFLFSGGSMTDLGVLSGFTTSKAYGINDSAVVVGELSNGSNSAAFVYSSGTMVNLNSLIDPDSGWSLLHASSINDYGQIVGTGSIGGAQHAFLLNPIPSPDDTPPATQFTSAPSITTSGGTTTSVTVKYNDPDSPVATSSIGTGNVSVTGPKGALTIKGASVTSRTPTGLTAVYTVAAPGGQWTSDADGTYTVTVLGGQVADFSGNKAATVSTTFSVNITSTDTTAPTAVVASIPQITSPTSASQTITVTYSDNTAVKASTIGKTNIAVSGPAGTLSVTNVQVSPDSDSSPLTATYTVAAPSGGWSSDYDGTYNIALGSAVVTDTSGNPVASLSGSFKVNIPVPAASTLDTSFTAVALTFTALATTTDPSGNVLVAGFATNATSGKSQAELDVISSDGGSRQTALVSPAGTNDRYTGVQIDPGSSTRRLLSGPDGNGVFTIDGFTSNFTPDTTYGNSGSITLSAANTVIVQAVTAPDQTIYAVGESNGAVRLLHFDATGGFLSAVTVPQLVPQVVNGSSSEGIAVQGDGKVLVAGQTAAHHFGLVRFSGSEPDSSFGSDGFVTAIFGGQEGADCVSVDDIAKVIGVFGSTSTGGGLIAVAMYDFSGNPLAGFGTDGQALVPPSPARELTLGSFLLRGVGSVQGTKAVVANSKSAPNAAGSSTVQRILVPATSSGPVPQQIGTFGQTGKKITPLSFTLNGVKVTLALKGGSGTAFQDGNNLDLTLTGGNLTIKTSGGRVTLNAISVQGNLSTLAASTSDLAGNFTVSGNVGKATLGGIAGVFRASGPINSLTAGPVSGDISSGSGISSLKLGAVTGTVAAAANIKSLNAAALTTATVLAGANLGNDGKLGGGDDAFAAGSIFKMSIGGAVASSVVAAGVDPLDGIFANGNDTKAGAGGSLKSLTVKGGVDSASHFEAQSFGNVKAPGKVNTATDTRFTSVQ
jgi:probable HAF family extracellular repeat protein